MNLRQLRYFARVVELGNMTRAAEQLGVAQPALGLQIRQLEEGLGVPLLSRHSRGVEPTPAGKLLYERAAKILQMVEETVQEVAGLGGARETIRLGLTPSLMLLIGSDLLVKARDELPGAFLSLAEEMSFQLVEALERGALDLALAYEVADLPGLSRKPLIEEELLLVTTPDGRDVAATIPIAEALAQDLVLAGGRDPIRKLVDATAARLSLKVTVAYEAHSIAAMKKLVSRGVAASIMPYGTAVEELRQGSLVARRIDPPLKRILYLVRPAARPRVHDEEALATLLESMLAKLAEALGPLGRKLGSLRA